MTDPSKIATDSLQGTDWVVRFVSTAERRQVIGHDLIVRALESQGFKVDHEEYKITKKTEHKRPINPKKPDGPKETVVIEEKINVNGSIRHLRQLAWRATKDEENLLLVQLERLKGESVAVPLIYREVLESGKAILVTGLSRSVHSQLLAKPDIGLNLISEFLAEDKESLEDLVARSKRKKGFQSAAREIMDLQGLSPEVSKRISEVALGKAASVTDEEAVNILLLSDLYSRYQPILIQFWEDVKRKSHPPAALAKQFELLCDGIPTMTLVKKFSVYLDSERKYKNNAEIFLSLFACLQEMDKGGFKGDPKLYTPTAMWSLVKGVMVIGRSQIDPDLWGKCVFFFNPEDERTETKASLEAIVRLGAKFKNEYIKRMATSSQSLQDIFDTVNADRYLKRHPLSFGQLDKQERSIAEQWLKRRLGFQLATDELDQLSLFTSEQPPIPKLIYSMPTIGGAYGYTISQMLKATASDFLKPDAVTLGKRMGKEFFEICYFKCVVEPALPVTRGQFGRWLTSLGMLENPEAMGFVPDEKEEAPDAWINDDVLKGTGNSIIPKDVGPDEFSVAYQDARQKYQSFFAKLRNHGFAANEEYNPAKLLLSCFEQGIFDFGTPAFRHWLKGTYLHDELEEVISNCTAELKETLAEHAKGSKLALFLPQPLAGIFYMPRRFNIRVANRKLKVHLLLHPAKKPSELFGAHRDFAKAVSAYLKGGTEAERQGLVQAMQMIAEYQKGAEEYLRFLGLFLFDRFLHAYHRLRESSSMNSPSHIKYWIPDNRKLVIGNLKGLNLAKMINFVQDSKRGDGPPVHNQSLAQFAQGIFYYQNSGKRIKEIAKKTKKLAKLFDRFSDSLKKTSEFKRYEKKLSQLTELLERPVELFTAKKLAEIEEISMQMKQMADNSDSGDAVVARLQKEWIKRYPQDDTIAKPHKVFSHERNKNDNFLMELTLGRDLVLQLQVKRCVIFVPEQGKKGQMEAILNLLPFISQHAHDAEYYLEISSLDQESQKGLAREIDPTHFFSSEKIQPIPKAN